MGFDIDIRVLKGDMHAGASTDHPTQAEASTASLRETSLTDVQREIEKKTKKKKKSAESVQRSIAENFRFCLSTSPPPLSLLDQPRHRRYQLPVPQVIRMDIHLFERLVAHSHLPTHSTALIPRLTVIANFLWWRISSIALSLILPMVSELEPRNLVTPPYSVPPSLLLTSPAALGRDGEPIMIPAERRAGLIPCTQHYPVEEVMLDLLHMSAISLKLSVLFPFLFSLSL
jgi:hypothetical protein